MMNTKLDEIALLIDSEWSEQGLVPTKDAYTKAKAILAELSKDAEHACEALGEPGSAVRWWWSDYGLSLPKGTKLYTHPQPVEVIEQRVAEACASLIRDYLDSGMVYADKAVRSGKWREYL